VARPAWLKPVAGKRLGQRGRGRPFRRENNLWHTRGEDYVNKMPFKFTGTFKKVVVQLGKSGLTARDEKELEEYYKKLAAVRD
jgi:hypothetical protein